jgi:hypothetical protein
MLRKLETYLVLATQVYDMLRPVAPVDSYSFYRYYVCESNASMAYDF